MPDGQLRPAPEVQIGIASEISQQRPEPHKISKPQQPETTQVTPRPPPMHYKQISKEPQQYERKQPCPVIEMLAQTRCQPRHGPIHRLTRAQPSQKKTNAYHPEKSRDDIVESQPAE